MFKGAKNVLAPPYHFSKKWCKKCFGSTFLKGGKGAKIKLRYFFDYFLYGIY
jgi:hypothetical protein